MNNAVSNYAFTIIEDGQVPLSGDFGGAGSFLPVVLTVAICLLIVAITTYTLWFLAHTKRVRIKYADDMWAVFTNYYFNPFKLIRDEREMEYLILGSQLSN